MAEPAPQAGGIRTLDTSLIIFAMIVLAAALTWVVPAGAFEKAAIEVPGAGTREVVVPGSYRPLPEASPQGVGAILLAPIRGMVAAADIIAFVLLVGGAFAVLARTGAVDAGLRRLVAAARRSPRVEVLIIPLFMVLFSLGGAIFGMAEETIPFVLIFVPMALSLGYDSITGVAIPFVGSQAGFAAAFLNPFTIGVAQGIAEVPLFSGIGYRLAVWAIVTAIAIAFVMLYARRVKREPTSSPVHGLDQRLRDTRVATSPVPSEVVPAGTNTPATTGQPSAAAAPALSGRQTGVLVAFLAGMLTLVYGVIQLGWYIEEIAALFVAVGIAVGVVGGLRPSQISGAFMEGARDLVVTAVIIGFARAILIVLQDGQIIDTILDAMASVVAGAGPIVASQVMFVVQSALNFFVPSGSGQAALSMPIMAPLADLVGVSRQTAVLAFQLGDGFTNLIIPTNPVLIGAISLGGVPWQTWARWMLPLQVIFFVAALLLLVPPVLMGWGVVAAP